MKLYLCIFDIVLALVLVSCEPPEEVKKMFQECAKELALPAEAPKGSPDMDDPVQKCFFACVMKKKGELVDGKVYSAKAIQYATKYFPEGVTDVVSEHLSDCAFKANLVKDECYVAGAYYKCMNVQYPDHYKY